MYTSIKLPENPHFKMTGHEFNALVNTLEPKPTKDSMPVECNLVVRTTTSNEVLIHEDTILIDVTLDKAEPLGYFKVLYALRNCLVENFGDIPFEVIKETVMMPIGAFEFDSKVVIYMNLIIQDNQKEYFQNPTWKFESIDKVKESLNPKSNMVKSTLNLVK